MSQTSSSRPWGVWKECLLPGRVVISDGSGQPFSHTFTRDEVAGIGRLTSKILAAGYHVPLNWEHQDNEPDRVRLSQVPESVLRTRGIFGFLKKFRTNAAGRLEAFCEGTDADDLRRFEKVRFVSPEVQWGWRGSAGEEYAGPVITHLAATGRPVQPHQSPLGAAAPAGPAVQLSHGAETPPRVGFKIRLSLAHYAQNSAGSTPMPGMFDDDTDPTADVSAGKGTQRTPWERIAAALEQHCGLKLGDVATVKDPDDFATRVEIAAMNKQAEPDDDDMGDEDMPPPEDDMAAAGGDMAAPPMGAAPAAPPPMQMSLDAQTKRADAFARRNLASEIADLERSRKVGPAVAADLKARLKSVKLSFTPDGEVKPNDLTVRIDAYRRNESAWRPAGKKRAQLSHGRRPVGASPFQESSNPADDDAIVSSYESAVGRGHDD